MPNKHSLSTMEFFQEFLKKQCLEASLNRLQKLILLKFGFQLGGIRIGL
jgi:hypothetical protein